MAKGKSVKKTQAKKPTKKSVKKSTQTKKAPEPVSNGMPRCPKCRKPDDVYSLGVRRMGCMIGPTQYACETCDLMFVKDEDLDY